MFHLIMILLLTKTNTILAMFLSSYQSSLTSFNILLYLIVFNIILLFIW